MATTPTVEPCGRSAGQRLREALAELVRQQASDNTSPAPTATALCELAGVSRNALYRYHPDVLQELHKLAALVDHYFAAWQETRVLLERRERELAELRRNIKPNLVSSRS